MNIKNNNFSSIEQMSLQLNKRVTNERSLKQSASLSFDDILNAKTNVAEELKFSKHANERLASRAIDLSTTQLERLENGTKMAREKGIQESLVMVDNLAFIVNVQNNTVITAMNDSDDKIITNIDGAVII